MSKRNRSGVAFVNAVLADAGRPAISAERWQELFDEIRTDSEVARTYEAHLSELHRTIPSKPIRSWDHRWEWGGGQLGAGADVFYILPRVLQPEVIIETGVAAGSMTSFLLAALNRNDHGTLYSIDLPPLAGRGMMDWTLSDELSVGFLIPQLYKDRWSLIEGDATYELPALLKNVRPDVFFHDSDHTFEHMMFEYAIASKHLGSKSVFISDDVLANDAFQSYCRGMRWNPHFPARNPNIGVVGLL